jgi:hypothetical protein
MMDFTNFQTPDWICKAMVQMLPAGIITILEPTPGAGNLVTALRGYHVTAPEDFWIVAGHFDAVVMNPPFSPMAQGYNILFKCMKMTNTIIAVMLWLTIINSEKRTKMIMDYGLKSVTHLPRQAFKGARVQCCILNMQKGYDGCTKFRCIYPQN